MKPALAVGHNFYRVFLQQGSRTYKTIRPSHATAEVFGYLCFSNCFLKKTFSNGKIRITGT